MILTNEFFNDDTVSVAKKLIGKELVFESSKGGLGGIINETEAYTQEDEASHTFNGKQTARNQVMYGDPGTIYIYFIYGMYYCLNIVTEKKGRGCAVLIRGIIPTINLSLIQHNRQHCRDSQLTNGPAKLMMGLGIPKTLNNVSLSLECPLKIYDNTSASFSVLETKRIGIKKNKDVLWRFLYQAEG